MELQSVLTLVIETVFIGFAALVVFDFVTGLSALTNATEPAELEVELVVKLPDPWDSEIDQIVQQFQPSGLIFQLCLPPAKLVAEPVLDFSQLKLKELKAECAKRGIVPDGNKSKAQTWLTALMAASK